MSANKNIAPNQRRFCVFEISSSGGASELTRLAVHIVGAAVHRQHDYLGTYVDPARIGNVCIGEADATRSDLRWSKTPTFKIAGVAIPA
jgi:hypothetical protein